MQDIENEVESLNCEVKMAEKQKAISFLSMLRAPFRWPMFLSIMVILSQQLTGVNAAMFVLALFFCQQTHNIKRLISLNRNFLPELILD